MNYLRGAGGLLKGAASSVANAVGWDQISEALRKRTVLFIFKSAAGRFIKDMNVQHVLNPQTTAEGKSFTVGLEGFELNEDLINAEVLVDAPVRLHRGVVKQLRGEVSFSDKGAHFEVEGLDLTFDFVRRNGKVAVARTDNEERQLQQQQQQQQRQQQQEQHADPAGRLTRTPSFSSLLVGELDDDVLVVDDGDGAAASGASGGPVSPSELADGSSIDTTVSALSATIRQILHSLSLTVSAATIRLRVPPVGQEIVPGQPLPRGTVELMIHLPKTVTLRDDGSKESADVGNSFRKIVEFAGIRVCVSEAKEAKRGPDGRWYTAMSYADIVFSGNVERAENKIKLQYVDAKGAVPPKWRTLINITKMDAILAPTQLSRLSLIAKQLLAAPGANQTTGRSREEASEQRSELEFRCGEASLSVLQADSNEVVGECWRNIESRPIRDSLTVPYYGFQMHAFKTKMYNSTPPSNCDDEHHAIFDKYGHRYLAAVVRSVQIVERRPQTPTTTLLDAGSSPGNTKDNAFVFIHRTTCPLSAALARDFGIDVPLNHPRHIVRQDITILSATGAQFVVDVEILERFIAFAKRVEYAVRSGMRGGSIGDDDGGSEYGSALPAAAAATVTAQPAADFDTHTSGHGLLENGEFRLTVLFPSSRRPSPELYGPLTQRLFSGLALRSGADGNRYLGRSFNVTVGNLRVRAPTSPQLSELIVMAARPEERFAATVRLDSKELPIIEIVFAPLAPTSPPGAAAGAFEPGRGQWEAATVRFLGGAAPAKPKMEAFKAPDRPAETAAQEKMLVDSRANVALALHIHSLTATLHQDDLLLTLFMMGEVSDCVATALKRLDLKESEDDGRRAALAAERRDRTPTGAVSHDQLDALVDSHAAQLIPFAVAVNLHIGVAHIGLFAPRLQEGSALGEPLWCAFTNDERSAIGSRKQYIYHSYHIEARDAAVFVYSYSPPVDDPRASDQVINIRTRTLDLTERLPDAPQIERRQFVPPPDAPVAGAKPQWGISTPLLRSYAGLYSKSHNEVVQDPKRALSVCIGRSMAMAGGSLSVDLALDRMTAVHEPAHEGDHWLFALISFVSDSPTPTPASAPIPVAPAPPQARAPKPPSPARPEASDDDDGGSDTASMSDSGGDIKPPVILTHVTVTATDTLVQYLPYGHTSRVVALFPLISLDTGTLSSERAAFTLGLELDKASLYLHNNFRTELLDYDGEQGNRSRFGQTKQGISGDLQSLGFALVVTVEHGGRTSRSQGKPVTIMSAVVPDRPLLVEINGLCVHVKAAQDSFFVLKTIITHFLAGKDQEYLPPPFLLVREGLRPLGIRVHGPAPRQPHEEPRLKICVDDYSKRISQLVAAKLGDPPPVATPKTAAHQSEESASHDDSTDSTSASSSCSSSSSCWDIVGLDPHTTMENRADQMRRKQALANEFSGREMENDMVDIGADNQLPTQNLQWDINPQIAAMLAGGHKAADIPTLANLVKPTYRHRDVVDAAAAAVGEDDAHLQPGQRQHTPPPAAPLFSLSEFMGNDPTLEGHFTVHNPTLDKGTSPDASQGQRDLPPVAIEILVKNCHGSIELFGDLDFDGIEYDQTHADQFYNSHTTTFLGGVADYDFYGDDDEGYPGMGGGTYGYRNTRNRSQRVIANVHGLQAQVLVFEPNASTTMKLGLRIAKADIIDKIETSAVRTVLHCAIPDEQRDADTPLFEVQWSTILPAGVGSQPEEVISVRLLPIEVAVHDKVITFLRTFIDLPDGVNAQLDVPEKKSTMYFRSLRLHPLSVRANMTGDWVSFEGANLALPEIIVTKCTADELVNHLTAELMAKAWSLDTVAMAISIFGSFSPFRFVYANGKAVFELVQQPIDHARRGRSVYTGLVKGFEQFLTRLGAGYARLGADTASFLDTAARAGAGSVLNVAPLPRGSQPASATEGLARARDQMQAGILNSARIVRWSLEGTNGASLFSLPVASLAIISSLMRSTNEVLIGVRNSMRPAERTRDRRLYKSSVSPGGL